VNAIEDLLELLREHVTSDFDVLAFKEIAGVSRKYAIPLLEYFDRTHATARVGDKRVVIK
jgi:selenocysteine-specific elongation factor